jgi:alkylation response protein AidB-like acyl-CoA dehydrogenase
MIDFELTEDHKSIRNTVREFAQREVAPRIKELDEQQRFDR